MLCVLGARCTPPTKEKTMTRRQTDLLTAIMYRNDPRPRVRRSQLEAGTVLVNEMGQPMFRVSAVLPAKARNYVVVQGTPLHRNMSATAAGHKDDMVLVAE
jgi:hypothetical protein